MSDEEGRHTLTEIAERRVLLLAAFGLVAAIVAIYLPVIEFDFLEFDDRVYVMDNADIADGLTATAVRSAFTNSYLASWHPIAIVSHALDVELFGMNAGGHHVTNVVLHAVNAVLLLVVLFRLTGLPLESAFVAALFAVHPQHVEPVAWISSRKDLLSTLFMFVTIWAHLRYVERPGTFRYAAVCMGLTLGLLAKPMLVTLPFVLLLLDVWPLNRTPDRRASVARFTEKIPLFGICIAFMIATQWIQTQGGAVKDLASYPLTDRLANAILAYGMYIGKFFWPADLRPFYPHAGESAMGIAVAGSFALLLGLSALAAMQLRKRPYLFVGWFWFAGMLVPVIGLVQFGHHGMADRYTYVTHIGLSIAVVWALRDLYVGHPGRLRIAGVAALAVLASSSVVAARYVPVWKDDISLFGHARTVGPLNRMITMNMGNAMMRQGMFEEAVHVFRSGLDVGPPVGNPYNNIGACYMRLGRLDVALRVFQDGLEQYPDDPFAQKNVALCEARIDETERILKEMLSRPLDASADPEPFEQVAVHWMSVGWVDPAEEAFRYLRDAYPESPRAPVRLGRLYLQTGRPAKAIAEFNRALDLGADPRQVLYDRARAEWESGNASAARGSLEQARVLVPRSREVALMLERITHSGSASYDTEPLF